MSLWRPPAHDVTGLERNWYESCFRSHAAMCGCGNFIDHLNDLASRFGRPPNPRPPGAPQPPPIRPLPALPAPEGPERAPWRSGGGGDAEGRGGGDAPRRGDGDGGDLADAELLAALEDDAE
ncbi:hypothetical protein TTV2_gp1 [Torque teno virus 2]|uniref:ORF2, ORF1 genes, isolate: s-TTV CH71 n=1 Tax=Torque teno virus 2 TaxID=687341 RepID=Q9DTD3_9VIRU|nr:hypothetical protein TTV2_gp1 [Torque teno virus 2]BAB20603.1 unnamed protein product [Torque teno virus 2]